MITVTIKLQEMTCSGCGVHYAMPEDLYLRARSDGTAFYCPYGHSQRYVDTENDRIRRERDILKQQNSRLEGEKRDLLATAIAQLERAKKAEAESRKVKKRANAALCPCCNRHFANVDRHMRSKHPDIVKMPERKSLP